MTRIKVSPKGEEKETRCMKEVKTVWDDVEANKLITEGWTLIHAGCAHKDNMGYNAKAVFVLAR